MIKSIFAFAVAGFLVTMSAVSFAQSPNPDVILVAAGSCGGFYSTCAARCKKDNPADRNCASDHCAPKLAECKSSGCWHEGRRYGGGKTCNLKRG